MLVEKVIETSVAEVRPPVATPDGNSLVPTTPTKPKVKDTPDKIDQKPEDLLAVESTDTGAAELVLAIFGHRIRFIPKMKSFAVYGGGKNTSRLYVMDGDHEVINMISRVSKMIDHSVDHEEDVLKATPLRDGATIAEAEARLQRVENVKRLRRFTALMRNTKKMIDILKRISNYPRIRVDIEQWDSDGDLIQFNDGNVLNLRTGQLRPSKPTDHLSKALGIPTPDLSKDVSKSLIIQTIETMFPDPEVRGHFGLCAFHSLSGSKKEKILPYLRGPKDTMKTGILLLMRQVLGHYGTTLKAEDFETKADKRWVLGDLPGKRFAFWDEDDEEREKEARMLKLATSSGVVKGEKKYKDAFEFRLTFTLWGASNDLPPVKNDDALWGRIRLFNLEHVFGPNQEKMLELETVSSLQDLFIWIFQGREAYWAGGINKIPKALQDSVAVWRDRTDWVGRFVEECLEEVTMEDGWTQADFDRQCSTLKDMYAVNRWWREGQGISKFKHPLLPNFKEKLEKRGIKQSELRRRKSPGDPNSSKENFMVGWRLKPEVMEEYLRDPYTKVV